MKKWILLLAALLLSLAVCAVAAADGNVPSAIRNDLKKALNEGYEIRDFKEPSNYYGFVLLQKADGNVRLVGYRHLKDGSWSRWAMAKDSVPQGNGDVFFVSWIGNNAFEVAMAYNGHWTEQATYTLNQSGLWVLTDYYNEAKAVNVTLSNNKISYIGDDDRIIGSATGTIQRDVRYVNLNNIPATLSAARSKYTSAPDIPEGSLNAQEIKFTGGKKYAVYSGPGASYVRGANNKAAVSTNDWIQVFGRENGWIMIQYHLNSKGQMRIGWIEESALPKDANVPELQFECMEAILSEDTYVTDDPLGAKTVMMKLSQGQVVNWLATMGEWAYIEQMNGSDLYRGFVPLKSLDIFEYEGADQIVPGDGSDLKPEG